jgi:hypothetical protein
MRAVSDARRPQDACMLCAEGSPSRLGGVWVLPLDEKDNRSKQAIKTQGAVASRPGPARWADFGRSQALVDFLIVQTFHNASTTMRLDILDSPQRRSTKRIGISCTRTPLLIR